MQALPVAHLRWATLCRALPNQVTRDGQPQLATERLVIRGLPRDVGSQIAVKGECQRHRVLVHADL